MTNVRHLIILWVITAVISIWFIHFGLSDWLNKLAPLMKPTPYSKSSLGKVQSQMIKIISVVERSDRTDGPKPNELITRACKSHPGYGPMRTLITANIVERAYEEAMYLGLFNKKGKFTTLISKGPNTGEKIRFEYMIPPETAPEFSQDIANIRIVRTGQKNRAASLDLFEKAHLQKLKQMQRETRSRLVMRENESNHLLDTSFSGPDKGPHYEKWEAAMEVAGEAANKLPQLKLEAHKKSSAGRSNGNKMSVWIKLNNYIDVPTQVTVHCYILGRTEIKRILFKIGHAKKDVVLLPHDEQQLILYSPAFPSMKSRAGELDELPKKAWGSGKFAAQGWVIRVEHNGEVAAGAASMTILLPYADENFKGLKALP